jgi:hypothetical protein
MVSRKLRVCTVSATPPAMMSHWPRVSDQLRGLKSVPIELSLLTLSRSPRRSASFAASSMSKPGCCGSPVTSGG